MVRPQRFYISPNISQLWGIASMCTVISYFFSSNHHHGFQYASWFPIVTLNPQWSFWSSNPVPFLTPTSIFHWSALVLRDIRLFHGLVSPTRCFTTSTMTYPSITVNYLQFCRVACCVVPLDFCTCFLLFCSSLQVDLFLDAIYSLHVTESDVAFIFYHVSVCSPLS
jgi:hypothetical protein